MSAMTTMIAVEYAEAHPAVRRKRGRPTKAQALADANERMKTGLCKCGHARIEHGYKGQEDCAVHMGGGHFCKCERFQG